MSLLTMLSEAQWAAVSAIGTILSALFSAIGLWFVGWQIRAARKASDINVIGEFISRTANLEREFQNADEESKASAFFDILNHIEFLTAGLRNGLFSGLPRKFIEEKAADTIAMIEVYGWEPQLEKACSTPSALTHLLEFKRRERKAIDQAKSMMRGEHDQSDAQPECADQGGAGT